ncbi:SHOCT domain-containing protein [Neobacillus sp. SM06]|uniref:SHOCT domain-containing protein n=1 Tax=Neobacillus sp. SM06 TaxID=3422492 RepID=UPI003D27539E
MMGQGYGFGGFGMMGGGSLMMILLIAAVGFLVYLALKNQTPVHKDANVKAQPTVDSEALKIAKSRLASGEITVEEFEQIKKNLQ